LYFLMDESSVIIHFKEILTDSDLERFLEDFPARARFPKDKDPERALIYVLTVKKGEEFETIARLKQAYTSLIGTVHTATDLYSAWRKL